MMSIDLNECLILLLWYDLFVCHEEQLVWRAVENLTERLNHHILNGFGPVVDHIVEVLIAHIQLFVQPVL